MPNPPTTEPRPRDGSDDVGGSGGSGTDGVPAARRGLVLVCLAGTIWGTIGPAVQLAYEGSGLSPLTITAYRASIAVAVLVAVALAGRRLRSCFVRARTEWRRVVAVGVFTALFQVLFFVAVLAAGVSVTTVVCLGFAPVLLLVLNSVRRRRVPSVVEAGVVVVALVGLLLVAASGSDGVGSDPLGGVLLALAAGTAYALSAEVGAPLSQRLDTMSITVSTMTVAALVLVPGGVILPLLRGRAVTTTDLGSWVLVVYLGAVTMALAYALLFAGLRTTPSGTAVVATLLEPVAAVLIAVLLLGETLTPGRVVGSLLILAAIASLGRRQTEPRPQ